MCYHMVWALAEVVCQYDTFQKMFLVFPALGIFNIHSVAKYQEKLKGGNNFFLQKSHKGKIRHKSVHGDVVLVSPDV